MNDEKDTPLSLVEDLRKLVEKNELVHRKVAAKIGVSITTFSRWMNGRTVPTSELVLSSLKRFLKNNG